MTAFRPNLAHALVLQGLWSKNGFSIFKRLEEEEIEREEEKKEEEEEDYSNHQQHHT